MPTLAGDAAAQVKQARLDETKRGTMNIALLVIIAVIAADLTWAIFIFNRLVMYRNRFRNAYSQIDVVLKRRHELIPKLVQTVKAYAGHETGVLTAVTDARTRALSADSIPKLAEAEGGLSGTLKTLFAVAEGYPTLKADENFLRLQDEIGKAEDRIRYARQFYNDTVMRYNVAIETFPNIIIARLFHFRETSFFSFDGKTGQASQVSNVNGA